MRKLSTQLTDQWERADAIAERVGVSKEEVEGRLKVEFDEGTVEIQPAKYRKRVEALFLVQEESLEDDLKRGPLTKENEDG